MGSPNKPNDDPSYYNLYEHFNDLHFHEPMNHPNGEPPPHPVMNVWPPPPAEPPDDDRMEFHIDVDDLLNFEYNNDENVGGGKGMELATGDSSSNAGPSGAKELGFLWVPPGALDCGGCTLASEVHDFSNGLYNMRLAVHAVGGYIDHMVFDVETTDVEVSAGVETFYINFQGQNTQLINTSLAKYGIQINEEDGSILLLDSLIAIYNNILGGLVQSHMQDGGCSYNDPQYSDSTSTEEENTDIEEGSVEPNANAEAGGLNMNQKQPIIPEPTDFNQACSLEVPWVEGPGESSGAAAAVAEAGGGPPASPDDLPEVPVQKGRERGRTRRKMTLLDLAPYFHIKAGQASAMLRMCLTTLKLMCRKLDLERWPYRKVRSIDNRITGVKRSIREKAERSDVRAVVRLQEQLKRLKEQRRNLYLFLTRR